MLRVEVAGVHGDEVTLGGSGRLSGRRGAGAGARAAGAGAGEAHVNGDGSISRAGESSVVVVGLVVDAAAFLNASFAGDRSAAGVGGGHRDTIVLEGVAVDVGEIVVDRLIADRVFELGDGAGARVGSNLDGDSAAVGVGLVRTRVLITSGDGLHLRGAVGDDPEVDIEVARVLDDGATSGSSGGDGGGERGESSETVHVDVGRVNERENVQVIRLIVQRVVSKTTRIDAGVESGGDCKSSAVEAKVYRIENEFGR